MKKKTQVILGLSSIVAVTAGVAGASTFAWFTTTRTAQVNLTSAKIYNTTSKLVISYGSTDGSTDGSITSGGYREGHTDIIDVVGSTNAKMTDVSGDGVSLYRPDWVPGGEGVTASAINKMTNASPTTPDYYYLKFSITLSNDGNARMKVFLNTGSSVFAHAPDGGSATAASTTAAKATRVAILDSNNDLVTTWQYNTEQSTTKTDYKYLAAATGGTAYGVSGYEEKAIASADKFHLGDFSSVYSGFISGDETESDQYLCTLEAKDTTGDNQTLWFVIWLEGTSNYAKNTDAVDAIGGLVDMTINIAGY